MPIHDISKKLLYPSERNFWIDSNIIAVFLTLFSMACIISGTTNEKSCCMRDFSAKIFHTKET